jgi:diacylglycerol kinase (ATP)
MRTHNLLRSFGYALAGLSWLVRTQRNARIHLVIALVAVALGAWLGLSGAEWAVLLLTIGLVLAAEAFNTALEAAVDLASPEWHALARIAKDVSAGGVLVLALAAVGVGVALFAGRLLARLGWA